MSISIGTSAHLDLADRHLAHNYHPLDVVIAEGEGSWVTDIDGVRYLDALAAYSALNFGHRHPRLLAALSRQMQRLTLTSRAVHNDRLGPFAQELAQYCGKDAVLPMNTGAEAVETALKIARKWAYDVKGLAPDTAEIVVAGENFHGRTISIISFSSDPLARSGFGPFTPGFLSVRYGDVDALRSAIGLRTAAVLVEPIQGEAGVVVPPRGYLTEVRRVCDEAGILMVADEVQAGLGRTGKRFACDHEAVIPDLYILGKALGGGLLPVSAVVGNDDVLSVIHPGEHGSTFGGNPLAAAVGHEVVRLLSEGEVLANAAERGRQLHEGLWKLQGRGLTEIRGEGLWAGVDIAPEVGTGRSLCEELMRHGVLAKETHGQTLRLAPPLTVSAEEVDFLLGALAAALDAVGPCADRANGAS